jgi:hypothetical protein
MNFSQHKRNIDFLKYIDQKNKEIQQQNEEMEEKKNNEPLYKIKRFEQISSRLAEQTEEWVKKEAEKRRRSPINYRLNPPNKNYISPYYDPYSINKQNGSLFDRYYRIKKENNNNRNSNSIYYNNNNNNYNYHPLTSSERNNNNHESKSSLPKNEGLILPKIEKNFLRDNIDIVKENKVPKRYKSKQENRNDYQVLIEKKNMKKEYNKYIKNITALDDIMLLYIRGAICED